LILDALLHTSSEERPQVGGRDLHMTFL